MPAGYLHYGPILVSRDQTCQFCEKPFVGTPQSRTCAACIGTPAHTAWRRRNHNKYRRAFLRRKAEKKGAHEDV